MTPRPSIKTPGAFRLGSFRGAPIDVHWSALLGMFLFSGAHFAPAHWLAWLLIVLVHEMGHAVLVRRYRLRVLGIVVHGIGGECVYVGTTDERRSIIAWGGVLGQLALFAVAAAARELDALPRTMFIWQLTSALLVPNLFTAALNLIPLEPLDGARAWRLFPQVWRERRRAAERRLRRRMAQFDAAEAGAPPEALRDDVKKILEEIRRD
jgi:Zn-dependent protease